jgi:alkanesulfonate monooxygenase SsuD/methylene tetrahydromethanopterin reductase-like flavin-dependent oxidoreductase (luciferase family)
VHRDTDEEAREIMREGQRYFHRVLMHSIRDAQRLVIQKSRFFDPAHGERHINRLTTLKERSIDEMIEAGSIFCGSPASVVKQMRRVRDTLGNGRFNINMKIGNIPDAAVHRGMELFRDKVLPRRRICDVHRAHDRSCLPVRCTTRRAAAGRRCCTCIPPAARASRR